MPRRTWFALLLLASRLSLTTADSAGGAPAPLFSYDAAFPRRLLDPESAAPAPLPDPFVDGYCSCYGPTINCYRPDPRPDGFWLPAEDAPRGALTTYGPVHPGRAVRQPCLAAPAAAARHAVLQAAELYGPAPGGEPAPGADGLTVPDPGLTRAALRALGLAAPVLLHSFDRKDANYEGLLATWAAHVARAGLQRHALLVGGSAEDCAFGARLAPCVVTDNALSGFARTHPGDVRWFWSLALLRASLEVVQTDCDALPLSNFMGALTADDAPLVSVISDRDYHGEAPRYGNAMWYCRTGPDAPCQSTAFSYFRPRGLVIHELEDFVAELQANTSVWEQELWDRHARRLAAQGPHVYRMLPSAGSSPFLNWDDLWERLRLGNESFAPAMVHMGGKSIGDKVATLKCAQLWVDTPCASDDGERR